MTTPSQASEAGRLRLFAFKPQSLIISAIVCFGIPVAIAWFIISQAPLSWTNFREESNGIGVAVGIGFWLLGFWYYSTFRNANDDKGMAKVLVWAMRIALALTLVVVFMAFFAFSGRISRRAPTASSSQGKHGAPSWMHPCSPSSPRVCRSPW